MPEKPTSPPTPEATTVDGRAAWVQPEPPPREGGPTPSSGATAGAAPLGERALTATGAPDPPASGGSTSDASTSEASGSRRQRRRQRQAEARKRSHNRALVEWVIAIGVAVIAALIIKTFLVQAFVIPSGSMEHTLEINDRVLVSKFAYHISDIKRGDVIVFKNPKRLPGEPAQLIKRVAATEGDVIEGVDGKVEVNGQVVDEPYLAPNTPTLELPRQTVPAGHVFVLGDNRTNSKDSRFIGPIATNTVIGKAFFRIWPPGRLGGL